MAGPLPSPLLVRDGNFTPPTRTPWGGRRIRALKGLGDGDVVGESWEVSVEPDFPSTMEDGRSLDAVLRDDPRAWLGRAAGDGGTSLLVKLVDADDELSVQIHPEDAYAGLRAGESGKPESWYVVAADPGAGLYLGFRDGVTRADVERALAADDDVSKLLFFVPVAPGDFFLIGAGTAHAIGRGVLLVEPQRVRPGRNGLTYRYWDWRRRYDAKGKLDAAGAPRALHVEHALAVTRWDAPREEAFLASRRMRGAGDLQLHGAARVDALSGAFGGLEDDALDVARLSGTGELALPAIDALVAVTVLEGEVAVGGVVVKRGRSAVLPASLGGATLALRHAHAVLSAAR